MPDGDGGRGAKPEVTFLKLKNTVLIDSGRPSWALGGRGNPENDDLVDFLKNDLKLKTGDIEYFQFNSVVRKILVAFKTEEKANEVAALLTQGVMWTKLQRNATGYKTDAQLLDVLVLNLEVKVSEEEVKRLFAEFGEVKSIKKVIHQEFGGVWDGRVIVSLQLREGKTVPEFIYITGNDVWDDGKIQCKYRGQVEKCYKCGGVGHFAKDCNVRSGMSYAGAASKRLSLREEQERDRKIEEEKEEKLRERVRQEKEKEKEQEAKNDLEEEARILREELEEERKKGKLEREARQFLVKEEVAKLEAKLKEEALARRSNVHNLSENDDDLSEKEYDDQEELPKRKRLERLPHSDPHLFLDSSNPMEVDTSSSKSESMKPPTSSELGLSQPPSSEPGNPSSEAFPAPSSVVFTPIDMEKAPGEGELEKKGIFRHSLETPLSPKVNGGGRMIVDSDLESLGSGSEDQDQSLSLLENSQLEVKLDRDQEMRLRQEIRSKKFSDAVTAEKKNLIDLNEARKTKLRGDRAARKKESKEYEALKKKEELARKLAAKNI